MWVHANPNILKCGRLTVPEPTDPDPEKDPEVVMKQLMDADPFDVRLRVITEDKGSY